MEEDTPDDDDCRVAEEILRAATDAEPYAPAVSRVADMVAEARAHHGAANFLGIDRAQIRAILDAYAHFVGPAETEGDGEG